MSYIIKVRLLQDLYSRRNLSQRYPTVSKVKQFNKSKTEQYLIVLETKIIRKINYNIMFGHPRSHQNFSNF